MPSVAPTRLPTATAAKPISNETREPKITRDSTSRPRWSVPSGYARPSAASIVGGLSLSRSDWRSGSCGASTGAAAATTNSAPTNASASSAIHGRRRRGVSSTGTETGIEDAIEHVDQEVDDDERRGGQEHRALHDRIVAVVDRLDRQPADPRPREDGLRHDRAGEKLTELEAGDRDDRQRGVAQRVLADHERLRHALRARRAHEVGAQHLEHRGAREPRDRRHRERAQREARQHEAA